MDHFYGLAEEEMVRVAENRGLLFYKLFWVFVIGGVIGFIIETLWCWYDFGEFTSRTSNLFFPMSCVWGAGCVFIWVSLRKNRWNHAGYIFLKGMILCAVLEYGCGLLGEKILGVTFWDYTSFPMHLGKYINIPFCILWGVLSIAWIRCVYPWVNKKLDDCLKGSKHRMTKGFIVFMMVTNLLSGIALIRMSERHRFLEPKNQIDRLLDQAFPDHLLQTYFPKMKDVKTGEKIYVNDDRGISP